MNIKQYAPGALVAPFVAACVGLLAAPGAQAQAVRQCQVAGHVVYQNSPCAVDVRVAMATPPVTATTPPAPKKRGLADLLRERDGTERARPQVREFQGDGATVLKARMGAY